LTIVLTGAGAAVGRAQVPVPEVSHASLESAPCPAASPLATCPYCRNWNGAVNPDCPEHGAAAAGGSPRLLPQASGAAAAAGGPPINESWLEHPISAGIFIGVANGSMLIDDWVGQQEGMFGGVRVGYDFGERVGAELRYGFGAVQLFDSAQAIAAKYPNGEPALADAKSRYCDLDLLDASVLVYPWGDTPWRPYLLTGIGLAQIRFSDVLGNRYSTTTADIPLGVGLKFHCTESAALRLEVNDTIIFGNGSGFNSVHELSVTGGLEFRFGGSHRAYWPWSPESSSW
jgi:hypothetical protein